MKFSDISQLVSRIFNFNWLRPAKKTSTDYFNELCNAAQAGNLNQVQSILKKNIDLNQTINGAGKPPLFIAAQNGHLTVVQALLEKGADPNKVISAGGKTPLFVAV